MGGGACGLRSATVPPQLPGRSSLIRYHGGSALFHLTVGGKMLMTSAFFSGSTGKSEVNRDALCPYKLKQCRYNLDIYDQDKNTTEVHVRVKLGLMTEASEERS